MYNLTIHIKYPNKLQRKTSKIFSFSTVIVHFLFNITSVISICTIFGPLEQTNTIKWTTSLSKCNQREFYATKEFKQYNTYSFKL